MERNRCARIPCPVEYCSKMFYLHHALRHHVTEKHGIQINRQDYTFNTEDEFKEWKTDHEAKTSTQYYLATSRKTVHNEKRKFYNCCHSCGKTASNKINKTCTSRIEMAEDDNIFHVKFWTTHVHSFKREKTEAKMKNIAGRIGRSLHKKPTESKHCILENIIPVINVEPQKKVNINREFTFASNKEQEEKNACNQVDNEQSIKPITDIKIEIPILNDGDFSKEAIPKLETDISNKDISEVRTDFSDEEIPEVKTEPVNDYNEVCSEKNPILEHYNNLYKYLDLNDILKKKCECILGLLANNARLSHTETVHVNCYLDKIIGTIYKQH